jgi:hypothetical protein
MIKDLFDRHCSVRSIGYEFPIRTMNGVSFILEYRNSACADFLVALDVGDKESFILFGYRLSFCIACGRFIGFGSKFDVCWLCKDEMENDEIEDILE